VQPWQVPLHGALQHTPSTQAPLEHWSLAVQGIAGPLVGVQTLAAQYLPVTHCVSLPHGVQIIPTQKPLVHWSAAAHAAARGIRALLDQGIEVAALQDLHRRTSAASAPAEK